MKISIAEVRRRLSVGTEVVVTYVGGPQVVRGNVGTTVLTAPPPARRKIVKQTASQMASENLEGPKQGQSVWLSWRGVTAREENGAIFLSHMQVRRGKDGEDVVTMTEFVKFEVA